MRSWNSTPGGCAGEGHLYLDLARGKAPLVGGIQWVGSFRNWTFAKPENRMKFFKTAEQFLAKHLGGRFEP